MNPYDLGVNAFRTQVDPSMTSFSSPMNAVNMNNGNWGIDANYLTPAYMSPYRPPYSGPGQRDPYTFNPSWVSSAREMAGLNFSRDNYGGNAYDQLSPFHAKTIVGPADLAAATAQRVAMPVIAAYAAFRTLDKSSAAFGRGVGQGLGASMARGFGANGATAATVARGAGSIGSFVGAAAIPMFAAQAAVSAADNLAFDPYLAMRQGTNTFRSNFQNYSFGGGFGNVVTGGGLSNRQASRMASEVTENAVKDWTFDIHEINQIGDMSMRAGLLDNVNPDQFVKKIESLTKQVKVVMALANSSSIKEAIELMSKLQLSGATHSRTNGVLSSIASSATIGGISTQQLMNTVGAQGQYLFQQSGLTPYVGQMVAGQNYAAFSSAYRNGLISQPMMARMGGVEGATQSATSGMVGLLGSPYAAMYGMNAYFGKGGGEQGNIIGNVSKFGGTIANNPLEAGGLFNMTRPSLMSRMSEDRGMQAAVDFIAQLGKVTPGALNDKGQVRQGAGYSMLTQAYGLSHEQAMGVYSQLAAYRDPGTVAQMHQGLNKSERENYLNFARNNNLNMGMLSRPVNEIIGAYKDVKGGSVGGIGKLVEGMGDATDSLEDWYFKVRYGDLDKQGSWSSDTTEKLLNTNVKLNQGRPRGLVGVRNAYDNESDISGSLEKINQLAKQGNQNAIAFINSKGKDRANAGYKLAKSGHLKGSFNDSSKMDMLVSAADSAGLVDNKEAGGRSKYIESAYAGVLRNSDVFQASKYMDDMSSLGGMMDDGKEGSDQWKAIASRVSKLLGKDFSDTQLAGLVKNYRTNVTASGIYTQEGLLKKAGIDYDEASQAFSSGGSDALAKKYLTGGALESFLKSGKSQGDFMLSLAQEHGVRARGQTVDYEKNPYMDGNDAYKSVGEPGKAMSDQHAKIYKMMQDRRLDVNTGMDMINQLDFKEATGNFKDAVKDFKTAVDEMPNGKKQEGSLNMSTWFQPSGKGSSPRSAK